jgi:hypothetical protein
MGTDGKDAGQRECMLEDASRNQQDMMLDEDQHAS